MKQKNLPSMLSKAMGWGYKRAVKDIEKQIKKVIKKKRLVFLGNNTVKYTDINGKERIYNFIQFANVAVDVGGWREQMTALSVNMSDIVTILTQEYDKQKDNQKKNK